MNRSIFQILSKFNFKLFLINFFFILFLYFFSFLNKDFVSCDDLFKLTYNGIKIRYSPTLSFYRLHDSIEFFQNYILNTSDLKFKFNIFKYSQLNGLRFSRNHVYDHYHLNLYLNNIYNVHYGFTLTHHPEKLNLLPHEYWSISDEDLLGKENLQYVLNDLKIYDLKALEIQNDTKKFKNFILKNNEKCIFQFKKTFNVS